MRKECGFWLRRILFTVQWNFMRRKDVQQNVNRCHDDGLCLCRVPCTTEHNRIAWLDWNCPLAIYVSSLRYYYFNFSHATCNWHTMGWHKLRSFQMASIHKPSDNMHILANSQNIEYLSSTLQLSGKSLLEMLPTTSILRILIFPLSRLEKITPLWVVGGFNSILIFSHH